MKWPFVRRDTYVRALKTVESWQEIAQVRGNSLIEEQVTSERLRKHNMELVARALRAEGLAEKAEAAALAEESKVARNQELADTKAAQLWAEIDRLKAERDAAEASELITVKRCVSAEAELAAASKRIEGIDIRYDTLLQNYHALKLVGASLPEPKPERAPRPEPDPITQAMIAKGRGSPILMKQYAEYVTERRGENVPDAMIAAEIMAGIEDTEGVPIA